MRQPIADLEAFHCQPDPWGYEEHPDDAKRRSVLLAELPARPYRHTLDVGCGQGFVTRALPGEDVVGVDVSAEAITHARRQQRDGLRFLQADLFSLPEVLGGSFDLIVLTGVLYPQYVGRAHTLVYRIVDHLLSEDGILASVHIDAWYAARFPYLLLRTHLYPYREFLHRLELYAK
jgi:predicted TPR repeat methyltransferase